jgi:hypothetical protein
MKKKKFEKSLFGVFFKWFSAIGKNYTKSFAQYYSIDELNKLYSALIKCLQCCLRGTVVTFLFNYEMKKEKRLKRAIACLAFALSGLVPWEKIIQRVLGNIIQLMG